jgi:hypothetical protein
MPIKTNDDKLEINQEPHGHGGPRDDENPGYEIADVNVSGVVVFLGGLVGFLLVFFGFCFVMGRMINEGLQTEDGPHDRWHQLSTFAGPAAAPGKRPERENLASNPEMQQKELSQMTNSFPSPRLDIDDGNQATADLHAREDLLLHHYSSVAASPGTQATLRIPIDRAMELIAQRGLPVAAAPVTTSVQMAGDAKPEVQAPLTSGFARTGYELQTMEAREQKMSYSNASAEAKK